jgi:hypothetical protein
MIRPRRVHLVSVLCAVLSVSLTACVTSSNEPIITQVSLKIQAIQTAGFDVSKDISFRATVSVFQDLGYNIQSADLASGFISARSPIKSSAYLIFGKAQNYTVATAFVEVMGASRSKVRLNFVSETKTSNGSGTAGGESKPVERPEVYQKAFEAIRKAIFVRKNT